MCPLFCECRLWCGLSESTQCALLAASVNTLRNSAPPSLLSLPFSLSFSCTVSHSSLSLLPPLPPPQQLQTDTVAYKTFGLPHFTPRSLCFSSSHISLGLYKNNLVLPWPQDSQASRDYLVKFWKQNCYLSLAEAIFSCCTLSK